MKERTTGRLGFTLIEALVALVIVTLLSTIVVLRLTGTADAGEDLAAKSSLVVFQQLQETALRSGPAPLDALTMQTGEYDRGSVSFALEPSTSASHVAVRSCGSRHVVLGVTHGLRTVSDITSAVVDSCRERHIMCAIGLC